MKRQFLFIGMVGIAIMFSLAHLNQENEWFSLGILFLLEFAILVSTILVAKGYVNKTTLIKKLPKAEKVTRHHLKEGRTVKEVVYSLLGREFPSRESAFKWWDSQK